MRPSAAAESPADSGLPAPIPSPAGCAARPLLYSTYLGGGGDEDAGDLEVESSGAATITGNTRSGSFPVTAGAFQTQQGGSSGSADVFVTRVSPSGDAFLYSTYLGGTSSEGGFESKLGLGPEGGVAVAGPTISVDFPTTPGAFDSSLGGGYDVYVSMLDMLPTGVERHGTPTPGCAGIAALGVSAMPRSGGADFALRCVNGPPSAAALVGVSATCLPVAVSVGGLDLWLAVPGLVLAPVFADPYGTIVVPAPIPASVPPGASACVQLFLVDPCGPGGWSATSALEVTIQP